MWAEDNREKCLDFIREVRWTWFITLRYPSEPGLVPKDFQELTPDEAIECWLEAVSDEFTDGYPCDSVCIKEERANGEIQFHIVLNCVPIESRIFWRSQWHVLTGGRTWERAMSSNMQGLFRYLVNHARLVQCGSFDRRISWQSEDEKLERGHLLLWNLWNANKKRVKGESKKTAWELARAQNEGTGPAKSGQNRPKRAKRDTGKRKGL
jgi:hypothetical protein